MIRFVCDCGKSLEAQDESGGRLMRCPQCGRDLQVPSDAVGVHADAPPEQRYANRPRPDRDWDDGPRAAPPVSGKAIAALILGVLSLLGGMLVTGVPATILGVLGLRDAGRGRVRGKGMAVAGLVLGIVGAACVTPVVGLVYGVQKVHETAARLQSMNNNRHMLLAMHDYALAMDDRFPAYAIMGSKSPPGPAGPKPLLSWRVAILPYVEEDYLYRAFKLDEPWDSPHNSALLLQMPKVYKNPRLNAPPGYTNYRVFVSKNPSAAAALDPNPLVDPFKGPRLSADFPDGTPNTIVVVEQTRQSPGRSRMSCLSTPTVP